MPKKNKCYWSADGNHLPEVPLHTKVKHLILEDYIQRWIEVLTGHGRFGTKTVTLIDGFCGGGMYRDGNDLWLGSSIRMIESINRGLVSVQQRKPWYNLDVEYIFIDKDREHTACLELQMRNLGYGEYLDSGKCKIITGKFDGNLQYCIDVVKARKGYSFFFLDPFGLHVSPTLVEKIITLKRSEVLFTHMLSGLVRILKGRGDKYEGFFKDYEADDYYQNIADQSDFLARQGYLRNQGLMLFRTEGKADFAWTFAVMSNPKTVLYYLIHLSSNPTALDVMKQTLLAHNNLEYQYHYEVYGLGYRTLEEMQETLKIYDVKAANVEIYKQNLAEQMLPKIYDSSEGIPFGQLYKDNMEKTPATQAQTVELINDLRREGEVLIMRNGKVTMNKRVESGDLVMKPGYKKLWIPGLQIPD